MIGNHFLKNNLCLSVFLFVLICVFVPLGAGAAILYLDPSSGDFQPGDTFIVNVRIDSENECVNTIEVGLNFTSNFLQAIDFSQGESILTLWIKSPEIDQKLGLISFAGGIPGGYCGRIPGDPGASNLLGKIIFKIPETIKEDNEEISAEMKFLNTSQVLLNDGLGTKTKVNTKGAVYKILIGGEVNRKEWEEELKKDKTPPEPFKIDIHQMAGVFEGKYFLVFLTTDKQTGIDHYEISEIRQNQQEKWKIGESPYLLEDQSLESMIKVKAVDKAGNERIEEIYPKYMPSQNYDNYLIWCIIIILGIIIYVIFWTIKKNLKSRK